MKVQDVIDIGTLIVARPEQSMKDAADLMKQHRISGLPVVTSDGTLAGIITIGHLVELLQDGTELGLGPLLALDWHARARSTRRLKGPWSALTVGEVMSSDVVSVHLDTPLTEAARRLLNRSVHRAVVLDADDAPVAMLTSLDFTRVIAEGRG